MLFKPSFITYEYIAATGKATELQNPENISIFIEEMHRLLLGQGFDLYWTHHTLCPTVADYLTMVDMKTGGLFRMLTRMMIVESTTRAKISGSDMNLFSCLIGRFF